MPGSPAPQPPPDLVILVVLFALLLFASPMMLWWATAASVWYLPYLLWLLLILAGVWVQHRGGDHDL